jgi:GNAT superfamily N-acetyltransferase
VTVVRPATADDVAAMVELIQEYRDQLARWRPDFWRPADRAAEMSRMWFGHLVATPDKARCFVAEEADAVAGFLIATPIPVPPVYAAPDQAWTVDDFCVAEPAQWPTIGRALWDAVVAHGRAEGWGQLICVSPVRDEAKNAMLDGTALTPTSRWWSQTL